MTRESIDSLARRLAASLPQGVRALRSDLEENFRAVLKSSLARMDLVTREEFEVQEAVLARTREKLDALEERLAEYEARGIPATGGETPAESRETADKTAGKDRKKPAAKTAKKASKKTAKKTGGRAAQKTGGKAGRSSDKNTGH